MKKDKKDKTMAKGKLDVVRVLGKDNIKKHKNVETMKKSQKEKVGEVITNDLAKVLHSDEITNGTNEKLKEKNKKAKKHGKGDDVSTANDKTDHEVEKTKKELNESDLSKIEKKKAKKLAQKLKKQEKKAAGQIIGDDKKIGKQILKDNGENKSKKNKQKQKTLKDPGAENKINGDQSSTQSVKNERKQLKADKKKKKKLELKDDKEPHEMIPQKDSATIFVGNLPINTKRVQLTRLFEKFGPVSAVHLRTASGKVIYKHKQRLEAGTLNAYIVLKDVETANQAIQLNGIEFKSNHLRVTRADKNAHNSSDTDAKRTVFVGNLKYSATEEKLREIFSSCGEIEYVRCLRDGEKGCNGVAYICFKAPEAIGLALELKDTMLDERPIHVERYSIKKLGAKESRDATAHMSQKPLTGARKRLDMKNKKPVNSKFSKKDNIGENKKKGEFRGVKVDGIKKKQKKKKPPNHLQQLAKKIAPKNV